MKKHITDEKTGISYTLQGDYYIPDIALPEEEEKPIGVYGRRHLQYLKEHRRTLYTSLLMECKLNSYLADVNERAMEMRDRLIRQMAEAQGVTERLKEENQMEWVGKMNNIRACAEEVIAQEIIYE